MLLSLGCSLKVASFFSGIGGFDLAFEQVGCEVVFQCEKDVFCQKVLHKHWPDVPLMKDINHVTPNDVPTAEIWCAGFPCQDLSLANQGKRQGLEGSRSGLFTKFADLVDSARPKWVVLENVPGLLNSGDGRDLSMSSKHKVINDTLSVLSSVCWHKSADGSNYQLFSCCS